MARAGGERQEVNLLRRHSDFAIFSPPQGLIDSVYLHTFLR